MKVELQYKFMSIIPVITFNKVTCRGLKACRNNDSKHYVTV